MENPVFEFVVKGMTKQQADALLRIIQEVVELTGLEVGGGWSMEPDDEEPKPV